MNKKPLHLHRFVSCVAPEERARLLGQRGCVLWFTGLSGSGKSTLAHGLEKQLIEQDHLAYVLDGDNIRHRLNANLGFSKEDRDENIRRISEVARLFAEAGLICISAFISPFRAARQKARELIGPERFLEIYLSTPLEACERRDVKGLYAKARRGEIDAFTGISSPFEPPEAPDLSLDTSRLGEEEAIDSLMALLEEKEFLIKNERIRP